MNEARPPLIPSSLSSQNGTGVLGPGIRPQSGKPGGELEVPLYDLIELMFFAYRDFVGDADRLLEEFRFGRAHHRVLHFVHRHPGLSVAELLDILKITKQSLNRVMKELLDAGFIAVRLGASDRRQRRLFLSPAGDGLAMTLAATQSERFRSALTGLPEGAAREAEAFLLRLVNPADRAAVGRLLGTARRDPGP